MRVLLVVLCLAMALAGQEADLVLRGGVVWTGESKTTAVAVRGNQIVAVGPAAAAMKARRVIELKGRFAMPGFNDADSRFFEGAPWTYYLNLTGICSVPEMQKAIKHYATLHPERPWITGFGWEFSCFPNYQLPTREMIDEVVWDRPVYITAYQGMAIWLNSKAIQMAGMAKIPAAQNQRIVRDENGRPTGLIREGSGEPLGLPGVGLSRDEKLGALVAGMKSFAAKGYTSIQPTVRNKEEADLFVQLFEQRRMLLRTSLAINADAKTDLTKLEALRKKYQSPMFAVRGLSYALDGKIPEKSAAMLAPYDGESHGGAENFTERDFEWVMKGGDAAGWQIRMHASGDKAVRLALDGYEAAMKWNKTKGARHRIENVGVVSAADLPRFARLGVAAVMRPDQADVEKLAQWPKILGVNRMALALPWTSLDAAGARVAFASDWAGFSRSNPLQLISLAVNRTGQQRLTLAQALRASTLGGAYASGEEKIKGRLAVGQLADITVLDRDPFAVPAKEVDQLKVVMTVVDGRIVHGKD